MEAQQEYSTNAKRADEARPRILIVDDAPISLAVLHKVLSRHYDVLQATNGRLALELLRQGGISLVLTDVQMPEMSGLELLSAMKRDTALSLIPVMMITADGNFENETKTLELGAMDVIRKPFAPQILLARVRNLLALQAAYQTAEQNRKNERQLAVQAEVLRAVEHDELTGVLTRQAFYRHVRDYLNEHPAQQLEMLRFDLDNFSTINDLMGVQAGDRLLHDIGHEMLNYGACTTDIPLAGHIEADHFAALHDPSRQPAEELFFHIQRWLGENAAEYHLNCRLGVYAITDAGIEPSVMCDRALMALRSTKGNFTKRFARYDESMRQKLLEEQTLTAEMMPALKSGQFVVYYQPQINYSSGELVGAEALVRWNHPKKGLLPPSVFLPLFERNGQITQLDNFVWESVCRQIKIWQKKFGEKLAPVSVNISRVDTYGADLCSRLTGLIEKYQIPIHLLRLEITESAYVGDSQRLCKIVERLSQAGFVIEMDDFGSAYSSLNMLKDIPVDILKLDMKFLSDTKSSVRSGKILSSVVRMAHWLQLPVIAEGVETKQQADYLCSIGCLYMQGYYFSKPIPLADYEAFAQSHVTGRTNMYQNIDVSAAEQFWDASTQTALIFNSYVGGAVLLERCGSALEMLRANEEFFHAMHTTREEYVPAMHDLWQRFSPESQTLYCDMLNRAAAGAPDARCDIMSRPLSEGRIEWTRNRAKLLASNNSREIFYVSVENITAEREAQLELVRQKELTDRLYNGVPCGILDYRLVDGQASIFNFNDTAWKMCGYSNRAQYQSLFEDNLARDCIHPEDAPLMQQKVHQALQSDRQISMECRIAKADGSWFWNEVRLQRGVDSEGNRILQSICFDIDSRREKETQKYGRLLFSIFDEAFLLDYRANSCRILKEEMLDAHSEQAPGGLAATLQNRIAGYVLPDDRESVMQFLEYGHLREACAKSVVPTVDYSVRLPDKTVAFLHSTAFSIDEGRFLFCCRDITKEVQAQAQSKEIAVLQARLEEQERYRIIVEQTGTAVIEWNHKTGGFFHSGTYESYEMSRCDPTELMRNRGKLPVVHPDDIPALTGFFEQSKSGASRAEAVLRLRMLDGSYRWTRMRGTFVHDSEGKPTRTIGTFTDLDDEMRTKEKLEETDTKLESIIANIPSGVGIYRIEPPNTVIPLYVSDRTCQIFGFTRAEYDARIAAGTPVNCLPDLSALPKPLLETIKNGESVSLPRLRARRKDGSWFWLRLACSFITQENGAITCYATLLDVSLFVEAEQTADSVKELYQLLVESTQTITFDYSVSSDTLWLSFLDPQEMRVDRQYPAYEAYLKSDESAISVSSRHAVLNAFCAAKKREVHSELDFQATGPDGAEHWYHMKYLSLAQEHAVYRIIGRIDNLDRVMRTQEVKLEQAQIDRVTGLRSKDSGRAAVDLLLHRRPEEQLDAMLFLDIDDFKCVNDTVGHLEADHILAKVGAILEKSFRAGDVTARFGGDEFLIYMVAPGTRQTVLKKAAHLLEEVHAIEVEKGHFLGCSIGVVEVTGAMRNFESVFRMADKMMYRSKQNGKYQVSIEPVPEKQTAQEAAALQPSQGRAGL